MWSWIGAARLAAAVALPFALSVDASALDEPKEEKAQLEACEKDLCTLLVKKDAAGSNLQCNLQKTWASKKIKQGVEEKKLSWSLGDLRCGVKFDASRQDMVDALTKPEYELKLAHACRQVRGRAREGSAEHQRQHRRRASSSRTARR